MSGLSRHNITNVGCLRDNNKIFVYKKPEPEMDIRLGMCREGSRHNIAMLRTFLTK